MTYYVETYRPAYPPYLGVGVRVRYIREKDYSVDTLSPTMSSVWKVEHVHNGMQALACVIEHAAGKGTAVTRVF
jgi:hypothetical protein